jgi:hypothetical protein
MELKDLYGAVLLLVLIAILVAVSLILLAGLTTSGATTAAANTSINAFITAIGSIGTSWAGIIVLIIVASIIIGLVVRSFGGGMTER